MTKSIFVATVWLISVSITGPASAQALASPQESAPREVVEGTLSSEQSTIAVPALVAPSPADTPAGNSTALGRQIAEVISSDLRASGLFETQGPNGLRAIGLPEVTAPQFDYWKARPVEQLVQGFVRVGGDGNLTVGCYLYDVGFGNETTRLGFNVPPREWRRAAHKCADAIYSKLTGELPFFDSRIAYIAETGPKGKRVKRLAIMDSDGANHRFITNGQSTALTPRFSPNYKSILYLSYVDGNPRIYVYDIDAGRQRLITQSRNPTFAPRWSPDGQTILYSMAVSGNTDIYKISASGTGTPVKLTTAPGIDVGGSFSPDGRQIVFESDRSGSQQIYVMNADGTNQRRISFGQGRYATPEWSPRADLIAYTRIAGDFRVGTMRPDGSGERLLTDSWQDEAPTWAPNGRVIQFFRTAKVSGKTSIWQVDLTGSNERKLPTPVDGSDPAWGPVLP
ncbi:Tol-Pal system protein TolB [Sphingorhabdus sp. IMCC26285]|uniref:Tol-Pal system protein TolB n=1 Tax=Sphingorhabdus profundilacus TaxID=2509718 RepID=A0A6I4LWQ1_9SPHN|nr:Tol-Pal system beta propeller repeat protein TolB [Sphingorhabdus profundilacus]MVZ97977.1 Tol-Pal system protein TolB [Sphingorhabdus profundilacus]